MKAADFYEELGDMFWDAIAGKKTEIQRFKALRVRDTGRTNANPPNIAPYDFAINEEWYDKYKDNNTHRLYLIDYFRYEDPEGFGSKKIVPQN